MAEDEFAAFVHATGPQLYRAAMLLAGDHHLAEDLTQATYAKLFASWRRVRRTDNPVGYARTTLTNTFLSHRRLRRNSEVPTEELPDRQQTGHRPNGSDAESRLDLLAALSALSPTDRAVLVARYWEDRSVAQTAHDLGITETAVRTRARRALDRIRPHLADPALPHSSRGTHS